MLPNKCSHVFKSGKNKGNKCNKACYYDFCKTHQKQHNKAEINIDEIDIKNEKLTKYTLVILRQLAKKKQLKNYYKLKKNDLISKLKDIE